MAKQRAQKQAPQTQAPEETVVEASDTPVQEPEAPVQEPEAPVQEPEAPPAPETQPAEPEPAQEAQPAAEAESSTNTSICGVCGSGDVVYVQNDPSVSPAAWCAQHLPDNLKGEALEASEAARVSFNLEGRRQELSDLNKDDVYSMAQGLDLPGRSDMSKDDLVEAVLRAEIDQARRNAQASARTV